MPAAAPLPLQRLNWKIYVSARFVRNSWLPSEPRFLEYRHLRVAPTLFVLDIGVVFRKRGRLSHRANGASDSRSVTDHPALARPARFATS